MIAIRQGGGRDAGNWTLKSGIDKQQEKARTRLSDVHFSTLGRIYLVWSSLSFLGTFHNRVGTQMRLKQFPKEDQPAN